MNLRQLYLRNNACYQAGEAIEVKGIMVHITAENNPNLRRYVGPDDGLLGHNQNNNHWNNLHPEGRENCFHALIGKLADDSIASYQTLPWDMRGWHSGSADGTHIGFAICKGEVEDSAYFDAVYKEAVAFCAYLCRRFNLDPLHEGVLIGNAEGHKEDVHSDGADTKHLFLRHGKSMDALRSDVNTLVNAEATG